MSNRRREVLAHGRQVKTGLIRVMAARAVRVGPVRRGGSVRPVRLVGRGDRRQVEDGRVGIAARLHPLPVVLADQPLGIDADCPGDGANVTAHVQVPAARLVVIGLYATNDAGPDLGALAELIDRQARLVARLSQRFTDGHEPSTYRPTLG